MNGMRVVTRIFVNGELVLRVPGRPQFAGIGPAAFGDGNGSAESGGISLFANGRLLGTFAAPPQVTRQVAVVPGRTGEPVRRVTVHITGPLYATPAGPASAAGPASTASTLSTARTVR
jgi:hypothetical protein